MKKISAYIFTGIALAVALNTYATEEASETRMVSQHHVFDANSVDAVSVVAWLQQRKSEGQISDKFDPDSAKLGLITVEISTLTKGPIADRDSRYAATPETTGTGGVILPTTGSPGQTITITNCNSGSSSVTETWTWVVADNGSGSWVLTDVTTHQNHNVKCAGGA